MILRGGGLQGSRGQPQALPGAVVPCFPRGPASSPEDIGAGGRALVDILRQPPLHRHVPVPHAIPHPHAEVRAVAVDVADGLIVVLQRSRLLRTGGVEGEGGGQTCSSARPPPDAGSCPSPGRSGGDPGQGRELWLPRVLGQQGRVTQQELFGGGKSGAGGTVHQQRGPPPLGKGAAAATKAWRGYSC